MMKKVLFPILALSFLAASVAQAEIKIVTVSMAKLFEGYYKSEESNARLSSIRDEVVAEEQEKQAVLQQKLEAVQAMQEELQNPMLSESAKADKQAQFEAAVREGQQLESEFRQWAQQKRNELVQRQQQIRQTLIEEIRSVVTSVAAVENADLVLDTSDVTGSGVPTVLFANTSLDITNKVLRELNKDIKPAAE